MSATAQTNGKKSSNSSAVNTPASTPVTNGNSQTISQSTPPPPNNNAPKYGTLVPNRIFVGGISASTTEGELLQLFSNYGTVKAAKIIQDRAGVSKGYGFITFESEDDAKRPLKDADNIVLRERKLNIAPAIKKQPFNRAFDASSPSTVAPGNTAQYFFPPSAGVPYFQGGVTYYQQPPAAPGDPNSQPTTVYQAPPVYPAQTGPPQAPTYSPMMFPHHIYMPQQYAMPPMPYEYNYFPNNGGPQYMVGGQNGPSSGSAGQAGGGSQAPPMPPSTSPPRPPCYNAQLPPYAAEPVYYNMQLYGAPIEGGTPVYPEAGLDMPNGGYPELGGEIFPGFDEADVQGPYHVADHLSAQDIEHEPPPPPLYDTEADLDGSRQSKTPVVSLLSMEQQQEKDFVSMQGGRRVKLQPPPQPQPPQQPLLIPNYGPQQTPPPLFYNYNGPPVRSQMAMPPPYSKTANTNNAANNGGWRKSRYNSGIVTRAKPHDNNNITTTTATNNTIARNNDNHSNSSANAASVDENKNDHPAAVMHAAFHMYNGTRTYQNSLGRRSSSGGNPKKEPDNNNKSKSNFVSASQVRSGASMMTAQTTVVAAGVRRNKRSTRRNGPAGVPLSEIGAGDAPLPNNDVSETCKKMETLKM